MKRLVNCKIRSRDIFSKHAHQPCKENEVFPHIKQEVYSTSFGDDSAVVFMETFSRSETFIVSRVWHDGLSSFECVASLLVLFASDAGQIKPTYTVAGYFIFSGLQFSCKEVVDKRNI